MENTSPQENASPQEKTARPEKPPQADVSIGEWTGTIASVLRSDLPFLRSALTKEIEDRLTTKDVKAWHNGEVTPRLRTFQAAWDIFFGETNVIIEGDPTPPEVVLPEMQSNEDVLDRLRTFSMEEAMQDAEDKVTAERRTGCYHYPIGLLREIHSGKRNPSQRSPCVVTYPVSAEMQQGINPDGSLAESTPRAFLETMDPHPTPSFVSNDGGDYGSDFMEAAVGCIQEMDGTLLGLLDESKVEHEVIEWGGSMYLYFNENDKVKRRIWAVLSKEWKDWFEGEQPVPETLPEMKERLYG